MQVKSSMPKVFDETEVIYRPAKDKAGHNSLVELKPWQQRAFWMLFQKKITGIENKEIAKQCGVSEEWLCKFGQSEVYKKLAFDAASKSFSDLTPLAMKTIVEIMDDKEAPSSVRKDIAFKIIDNSKIGNDDRPSPELPGTKFIFNVENMTLNDVIKMKKEKILEIEETIGISPTENGGAQTTRNDGDGPEITGGSVVLSDGISDGQDLDSRSEQGDGVHTGRTRRDESNQEIPEQGVSVSGDESLAEKQEDHNCQEPTADDNMADGEPECMAMAEDEGSADIFPEQETGGFKSDAPQGEGSLPSPSGSDETIEALKDAGIQPRDGDGGFYPQVF
jgi:hypothetical protein